MGKGRGRWEDCILAEGSVFVKDTEDSKHTALEHPVGRNMAMG